VPGLRRQRLEAVEDSVDRDIGFEPREARAKAVVYAFAERKVVATRFVDIELRGTFELLRVPVTGCV
jgi:hypothetical protein